MNGLHMTHFCIICGREFRPHDADTVICPDCGGPPEAPAPSQPQETVLADQPRGTVLMSQPAYQRMCILCGQDFTTPDPQADRCPQCRGEAPHPQPEIRSRPESRQPTPAMPAAQGTVAVSESGTGPTPWSSPADVPLTWNAGDVILDLYEVKGELGKGGMGVVYRVHHRQWNIDLAVKTPLPEALQKAGSLENFLREAQAWVDLGLHPHIVTCYYVRRLGEMPRVFAECMEGGSLKNWMEDGRLYAGGEQDALKRILDCAIQFAWGLGYAHEKGLVHQDVKPANALMTPDGMLKVTDFGLVGAKGYTPAYAAPEQELGQAVSPRTDIWGWGVSVLEMFTGGVHWQFGSVAASVLENYLQEAPPEGIPPMPAALAELLRQCFQNDPDQRPASMDEVAERLMRLYEQETGAPYPRPKPQALDMRADSLNNKAVSLLDLGQEEEAVRCWQEALQADPAHLEANFNYGYYRWQRAEIPGSRFLEEFLALETRHQSRQEYWDMLGWIYLEQGNVDELEKLKEKVSDLGLISILRSQKHPIVKLKSKMAGYGPVVFSPDGQMLFFQEEFEENIPAVVVWNRKTNKKRRYVCGGWGWAKAAVFVPNTSIVIWGCKKGVVRWDLSIGGIKRILGKTSHLLKGQADVRCIAISIDGRYAYIGSMDGTISVRDAASGEIIQEWKVNSIIPGVEAIDVAPTGKFLVSGGYDNYIRLWDMQNRREVRQILIDDPTSIKFLPNDDFVLSGNGDSTLALWNLTTGQAVLWFRGHSGYIVSVDVSPDGRFAISGSADKTARLWDLRNGKEIRCLLNHGDQVTSVCFSPDSKEAITSGGGVICQWEILYPEEWKHLHPYPYLCFARRYVEVATHQLQFQRLMSHARVYIGTDSVRVAYGILRQAQTVPGYGRDADILEELARCGGIGRRIGLKDIWLVYSLERHSEWVTSVAISQKGDFLISGSDDRTVRIWDLKSGQEKYSLKGHRSGIGYVVLSPDGKLGLSACGELIIVWDIHKGVERSQLVGRNDLQHFAGIHFAVLSPKRRLVLTQSHDPISSKVFAYLWDISGGEITTLRWLPKNVAYQRPEYCIFSPDEHYIISANNTNTLSIWDIQGVSIGYGGDKVIPETRCIGGVLAREKILGRITCLNISPNGQLLAFGSHDDEEGYLISVWNLEKEQQVCYLNGHQGIVRTIAFSPDGQFLISGGDDKTVRVWKISDEKEIYCLEGHLGSITSVALSVDGRYVASGSRDKTVRIWALDWDYDFPAPADWDEGARPYLDIFLTLHTPYGPDGLRRVGKPQWTEEDFQKLLQELGYRGYGWLRPEGVRRELEKMAKERS